MQLSKGYATFRCDKSPTFSKKKGVDSMLFVPLKVASKEQNGLKLFHKSNYTSL